jgi:hypothetical protein
MMYHEFNKRTFILTLYFTGFLIVCAYYVVRRSNDFINYIMHILFLDFTICLHTIEFGSFHCEREKVADNIYIKYVSFFIKQYNNTMILVIKRIRWPIIKISIINTIDYIT